MPVLSCRYYEHRFPEIEDVVMVTVRSIAEMGAYVHLLEYNKIEGMILLSELSRRRIRSINKLIRIGRDECVVVIRVDKDKGKERAVVIGQACLVHDHTIYMERAVFILLGQLLVLVVTCTIVDILV